MAQKSSRIIEIKQMTGDMDPAIIDHAGIDTLLEPQETFNGIEDKRFEPYVEHRLSDIVMISLLAVMARTNERTEKVGFALKRYGREEILPKRMSLRAASRAVS
jgi:hypothetical protein